MGLFDGFSGSEEGLKNSAFEAIKAELDKQDMKYGEDVTEDGEDHIIRIIREIGRTPAACDSNFNIIETY